ncbi:MAG: hypothetical protein ACPGU1_20000 [Myxococcota bacterium]
MGWSPTDVNMRAPLRVKRRVVAVMKTVMVRSMRAFSSRAIRITAVGVIRPVHTRQ